MQLIITEKPSVGRAICQALGITDTDGHKGYMEGEDRIISWCIGHLVEPAGPEAYDPALRKWSYSSLPIIPDDWKYEVKEGTGGQFGILKDLLNSEKVSEVVNACDAGREGELIFRLAYKAAGCGKPVKRLWVSSMESDAILEGFNNLKDGADYENLYQSALCRQKADWIVGINGTRLFSTLYGRTLKVGRVQTPTLAMLVEREEEIRSFIKKPFYTVHLRSGELDAASGRFGSRAAAEELAGACRGHVAVVQKMSEEEKRELPPKLYDLTSLQRDANRLLGFTAMQTLDCAQALYEKRLVTYPRTDSRFLADGMGHTAGEAIESVLRNMLFEDPSAYKFDTGKLLNSGRVSDHHAIIPTKELAGADLGALPDSEMKVLSLIASRLLEAASEPHIYLECHAEVSCNGQTFKASGKRTTDVGWKAFARKCLKSCQPGTDAGLEKEEKQPPEIYEGMEMKECTIDISEGSTKPKPRHTEDSLLSAMERAGADSAGEDAERKGLGTPATRAGIIEKLVRDGFIRRESKTLVPTDDGIKLVTVLPDRLKSAALTAEWENRLSLIAKGEASPEEFMEDACSMVRGLVETYHEAGEEEKGMFAKDREVLGNCPKCGKEMIKGKFGPYCVGKCGMTVGWAVGRQLSDSQVKSLLSGKGILLKGLSGKGGKNYDVKLFPEGIEDYTYSRDGREVRMSRFSFRKEFPKKAGNIKNKNIM